MSEQPQATLHFREGSWYATIGNEHWDLGPDEQNAIRSLNFLNGTDHVPLQPNCDNRVLTTGEQLHQLLDAIPGHRAMALDLIRRNEEARKSGSRMTTFPDEQILADWYHRDYQHALQLCRSNDLPPLPSNVGAAWERFDRLQAWCVEALKCLGGQVLSDFQAQIVREQAEHEEWKKQHPGPIWDFVEWIDDHLVTLTMIGMAGNGGGGDDIVDKALAKAIELGIIEYPEKPSVPATTKDKCNVLTWLSNKAKAVEERQRGALPSPPPTASDQPGTPPIDDDSHLSPSKLAELFGVPVDALRKRLERWKRNNHSGWIENTERGTKEAKFLFRVGAVRAVIDDLRRATKRPANVQRE